MTFGQRRLSVLALVLLLLVPSLPDPAEANPFIFLVRGFVGSSVRRAAIGGITRSFGRSLARSGLRSVARGAGRSMIRSRVRHSLRSAEARRVAVHPGQARMRRIFTNKSFDIRDAQGQRIGRATVENDLLIFRMGSRKVGFAQWEKNGFHIYRASGRPIARIADKDDRIIVYDDRNRYLGQFIQDVIEDQVVELFVDAMGERHDGLVLPEGHPGLDIPERDRHYSFASDGSENGFSTIRDGILYVYDAAGSELIRGVMEEGILVLYDETGEIRGTFKEEGASIVAYDELGRRAGHIATQEGKAVYFEGEENEPSAWVDLAPR